MNSVLKNMVKQYMDSDTKVPDLDEDSSMQKQ